jgi:hypothetical protein
LKPKCSRALTASLAENTGSLGKSLYLYVEERELSSFKCQIKENLIVHLKTLLQI